jgi:enterochelin esterase-like enzyme
LLALLAKERIAQVLNQEMEISAFPIIILCCTAVYGKYPDDNPCRKESNDTTCVIDGKPGFCIEGECLLAFKPIPQPFLVKIRYPHDNKYAQNASKDASKMYLRGSGLGLSWEKGKMMKNSAEKDAWEFQLEFGIPGYELPNDKKPPARFEFRVYLDDSQDMLGPNFVVALPLSTNAKNTSKVPEFWWYPWFFSKKESVIDRYIYSPQLEGTRLVHVILPPSFQENTYKRYETMIVNDGQRLDMIVTQLSILMVQRALIKEVVVVGIPNSYVNRTQLLAVSNGSEIKCISGTNLADCNGCVRCNSSTCSYELLVDDYQRCYKWVRIPKVYGQLYLDFIQDTVIPECKSKYRALAGAQNFGIMGFSLGGLISCNAIWTRPQTFGSAACMSPSLWWPFHANATFPDDAGYEFTRDTLMKYRGARPRQKIYIDVGGSEGYIMVSPARNASMILAGTPYFEMNKNLWFYIWEREYHVFMKAVQRMWIPLIAFYGTEGSPQGEIIKKVIEENKTNRAMKDSFVFLTLFWMCLIAHIGSITL